MTLPQTYVPIEPVAFFRKRIFADIITLRDEIILDEWGRGSLNSMTSVLIRGPNGRGQEGEGHQRFECCCPQLGPQRLEEARQDSPPDSGVSVALLMP